GRGGELAHLRADGVEVDLQREAGAARTETAEVAGEQARAAIQARDGLEQAVAVVQAAVEGRDRARLAPVDPHHFRLEAHARLSSAARRPRALARVSSSSRSGSESATMPAPARNATWAPLTVMVRMRMLRSSRPSRVR